MDIVHICAHIVQEK